MGQDSMMPTYKLSEASYMHKAYIHSVHNLYCKYKHTMLPVNAMLPSPVDLT